MVAAHRLHCLSLGRSFFWWQVRQILLPFVCESCDARLLISEAPRVEHARAMRSSVTMLILSTKTPMTLRVAGLV